MASGIADAGSTRPPVIRLQVRAGGSARGWRYNRTTPLLAFTVPRNDAVTAPTRRVRHSDRGVRGKVAELR
jgi:hypothetical protein